MGNPKVVPTISAYRHKEIQTEERQKGVKTKGKKVVFVFAKNDRQTDSDHLAISFTNMQSLRINYLIKQLSLLVH